MVQLSRFHPSEFSRVMVFGGPKTGKSLIAGKLAEYFNITWFDLENGHDVLFQLPDAWQSRIDLIRIPDSNNIPMACETMLKVMKGPVSICNEHGKVSCAICRKKENDAAKSANPESTDADDIHSSFFSDVDITTPDPNRVYVIDSGTQYNSSALNQILRNQAEDYKPEWDDWYKLGHLNDKLYSPIQNLSANVIVISHEINAETEDKKKKLVPVAGTRNWSRNVAKYFDHVVYAEIKNKKHVFTSMTTDTTNILTGSRTAIDLSKFPGEENSSLLPLFKPELYGETTIPRVAPAILQINDAAKKELNKPNIGGQSAQDVLARLKK